MIKQSANRDQIRMVSLDMMVSEDAIVRAIDAYIDSVNLLDLGFENVGAAKQGRPAYPIDALVKLYIFGYFYSVRSSRKLQREAHTNVEAMWLLRDLKPKFKTIANFRKDNKTGFANLFKDFRHLCKSAGLYGAHTVAVDGSKFRAQNSKKNNFNKAKIDRQLEYIEHKYQSYLSDLDEADKIDAMQNPQGHERLTTLLHRREQYQALNKKLEASDQLQISTSDPDARALPLHMNIVEVGYNVQSVVDDKHNMILDYQVTNVKDDNALLPMAQKAKQALDLTPEDELTVLADKGYHKGEQIQQCHENNIDTLVAPRSYTDKTKAAHLTKDKFSYNKKANKYTCPNNKTLHFQKRYARKRNGKITAHFDRYSIKYSECKQCPFFDECLSAGKKKASQGRIIDRMEYQDALDKNKTEVQARKEEYRRRQAIVEHPFGTIKRQWGYTHTLLKTIPKVQTEFSIIFLCYNLKRFINILGKKGLKEHLFRLKTHILNTATVIMAVNFIFFKHHLNAHYASGDNLKF